MKFSLIIAFGFAFLVFLIQLVWLPSNELLTVKDQNLIFSYILLILGILFVHFKLSEDGLINKIVFVSVFALTNGFLISMLNPPSEIKPVMEDIIHIIFYNYLIVVGLILVFGLKLLRNTSKPPR